METVRSFIRDPETLVATCGSGSGSNPNPNPNPNSSPGLYDRGNGKMVKWWYQGKLMGFEWKYVGIAEDIETGETGTSVKQSRAGAIEYAIRNLLAKTGS